MVERDPKQPAAVLGQVARHPAGKGQHEQVNQRQQPFEGQNIWKIFADQIRVLRNATVVVILDPRIVDDLKKVGKIEQYKIKAVRAGFYGVLHSPVNAENIKRLDQQVDENQKKQVRQKLPIHKRSGDFDQFAGPPDNSALSTM